MGIEPTRDSREPHTGFEDQERHQTPVTSKGFLAPTATGGRTFSLQRGLPGHLLLDRVVKHHHRRTSEGDRAPGGIVDLLRRESHFFRFSDVGDHAGLALREHRKRERDSLLGRRIQRLRTVGGFQKGEKFALRVRGE